MYDYRMLAAFFRIFDISRSTIRISNTRSSRALSNSAINVET